MPKTDKGEEGVKYEVHAAEEVSYDGESNVSAARCCWRDAYSQSANIPDEKNMFGNEKNMYGTEAEVIEVHDAQ